MSKTEKVFVIGLDGMDPSLTKKFMDEGKMPNVKKLVEKGACREDLVMLGGQPTVTPPMWTTLATGANPGTHGITCFWNQDPDNLNTIIYNLDSRMCKAEQLWNVTAEAGKKTLVWHWPGSSWPPSSDNPNLYVVDGAQPAAVQMSTASVDFEKYIIASKDFKEVLYRPKFINKTGAGCVIEELEEEEDQALASGRLNRHKMNQLANVELSHAQGEVGLDTPPFDLINSPIKPASGWVNAPEDALEFTIVTSGGLTRRPALILKNAAGEYDTVAVYHSKKSEEPYAVMKEEELLINALDQVNVDGKNVDVTRSFKVLELAKDGSMVRMWTSTAYDIHNDHRWHPTSFYQDVIQNVGYVPAFTQLGGKNYEFSVKLLQPVWRNYMHWQAKALNYAIAEQGIEVIFSHLHMIDAQGHIFWHYAHDAGETDAKPENYQELIEKCYMDADEYIGEFLHLLDKDWTLMVVSDHGLLCREDVPPLLGDPGGVSVRVMEELGFTKVKKDENGQDLREIDWEHTKAVATRANHIWINLKGRDKHGIVDPADKYKVEDEIIDALYAYRDPRTNSRIVSMALRNREAVLVGMDGPECGDIVFFLKEGNNRVHADALSTSIACCDTSLSPIFVSAGKGIKQGLATSRVIREADITPTIAVLLGVRMPEQCEGAPVYQILE